MPQGSDLGPIDFSLYTTPLSKVNQNHPGICFHFYADGTQLYVHQTHKHITEVFDRLKNCLYDIRNWLLQTSLSLILIRQNLLCLALGLCIQILANFSQLIYLVILVSSLIQIFPSPGISGILVWVVFFKSGILNDSDSISHVKFLFWLKMPWLEVVETTVILV